MSTYLLLRDNKQTGPFSLSEIQTRGFKKYDLVWIEGKSAAWRYPGEIPELKPFAPIIEEQPYDRFFKKPSEQHKEIATALQQEPVKKEIEKGRADATSHPVLVEVADRKVYAALPAKKNPASIQQQTILIKAPSQIKEEPKKFIPEPVITNYIQEKADESTHRTDSYQPKEKYYPKKQTIDKRRYIQPIAVAACIIALLGAGIFIGMSISKNASGNNSSEANEKQAIRADKPDPQNVLIPTSATVQTEEKAAMPVRENENLASNNDNAAHSKKIDEERKTNLSSENKKASKPKNQEVSEPSKILPQRESIIDDSSSVGTVRQSTHRTDAINDRDLIKNNINNLVSVSANKYSVGTFGGISELQLTVNNKSMFPLDLVMVEVHYIQSNKKIYKTENIYYRNVRPGEAIMQEAPKSPRGIKIECKVALINAKESSVSYSGI